MKTKKKKMKTRSKGEEVSDPISTPFGVSLALLPLPKKIKKVYTTAANDSHSRSYFHENPASCAMVATATARPNVKSIFNKVRQGMNKYS